jgi:hypothetical protein
MIAPGFEARQGRRRVTRRRLLGATLALSLLAAALSASAASQFLYVVQCSGQIDRLDTSAARMSARIDLVASSQRAGLTMPDPRHFDGCLANGAEFDAASALVYSVMQLLTRGENEGRRAYQLVSFHVPGFAVAKVEPGIRVAVTPPRMLRRGGAVALAPVDTEDPADPTALDLSDFAPEHRPEANRMLEAAGDRVLLQLMRPAAGDSPFAVADRRTLKLQRLSARDGSILGAHLAPGGERILLTRRIGPERNATGLALLDTASGRAVMQRAGPGRDAVGFLAIAPNGQGIFRTSTGYAFIALGERFPADSPVRVFAQQGAPSFFAER